MSDDEHQYIVSCSMERGLTEIVTATDWEEAEETAVERLRAEVPDEQLREFRLSVVEVVRVDRAVTEGDER